MIIGVSGKIGSGKDTVGIIVQHLICESKGYPVHDYQLQKHLPLSDEKFTLIEYLKTIPGSLQNQSGWEIKKYAGKLKQIASMLTGVPVHKFEDQEFKNQFMPPEWNWIHGFHLNDQVRSKVHPDMADRAKPYTYRELLQRLGTEAMRHQIHEECWINALFADYKVQNYKENKTYSESDMPNWIITDVRFPNEALAIRKRNGVLIRVNRPIKTINHADGDTTHIVDHPPFREEHPSETSLDNYEFDHVIQNNGTIDDLVENVREILVKEKLI